MLEPDALLQGRYRILSHIGKGGMGTVYLAKDQNLGLTVAVKQNFFDEQRLIEAFKREARLLAGLRHSVLPQVKDYFIDSSGQYLVMEYISGDDLWTTLEHSRWNVAPTGDPKPLNADQVMHWAEQLLEALDYLHTRPEPVIHRDIKPHNLKVAERDQIILLDFGLAKGKPLWMTRVTTTGSLYGYTPSYAPIEQIRGVGTDPRSDLYALGATLYHLLTGVPPVDAATRADAFLGGEPDPLRPANEVNPKVPKGIAEVLMKAMEPHRNNRPASAADTLELLLAAKRSTVIDWQARREREQIVEMLQPEKEAWPTTQIEIQKREKEEQAILAEAARREEERRKEKEEAEKRQREVREREAREEADEKRREEQERKLREEAERKQGQEQERKTKEEAERQREEADRRQREEQDRAAKEWAEEHLRQEEAERRAREEQENLRLERELKVREDAARKKQQEEKERKAKEEVERLRRQQEETRRQLEREDADRRIQQQREAGERVSVKKQGPIARTIATVRRVAATTALTGTERQRNLRNTTIGTVFLVILAFLIWYLVSSSNEAGVSKPGSESATGAPKTPESTPSQVQVTALKPGSFAAPTRVAKVALSDDGSVLASAGNETSIRLWRANGTRELVGHTQNATSVAMSHDGQFVASGSKDGTIRLWRASDGAVIKSWSAHWAFIFSVGFSNDGTTLFSAGGDRNVRLWRIPDGVLIKTVSVPEKDYLIVTVNPDSSSLGVYRNDGVNNDGSFRVWSLADNQLIKPLDGWIPSVNCGAFSKDGLLLALGTRAGVEVWRVKEDRQMSKQTSTGVASIAFSPDAQTLAAGLQNGAIKLFSVRGELIRTFEGHRGSVNSLSFSANGQLLASGSDDGTVRVWSVTGGSL
jgi:serine/threonine protein kinase/WD40 repeat protein